MVKSLDAMWPSDLFGVPDDTSVKIWRYMDLARFVCLLSGQSLYLSRQDQLTDPFEGSLPGLDAERRDRVLRELGEEGQIEIMSSAVRCLRCTFFVSCWRYGEESEAMWRLYCANAFGVAIQTTYQKLAQWVTSVPLLKIGRVRYLDYATETFPERNEYATVMHKRKAFSHENEIRIFQWDTTTPPSLAGTIEAPDPRTLDIGKNIPFAVSEVVERIFVDPYAPAWFEGAIRAVVDAFSRTMLDRVVSSPIAHVPTF